MVLPHVSRCSEYFPVSSSGAAAVLAECKVSRPCMPGRRRGGKSSSFSGTLFGLRCHYGRKVPSGPGRFALWLSLFVLAWCAGGNSLQLHRGGCLSRAASLSDCASWARHRISPVFLGGRAFDTCSPAETGPASLKPVGSCLLLTLLSACFWLPLPSVCWPVLPARHWWRPAPCLPVQLTCPAPPH